MVLKYQLDKLDGLADDVKALYTEKDGKFVLAIDGLPDVAGLKSKVDELLAEKKAEKKRADEAAEAARLAAEEAARKGGDVAAIEKSWQEKLAKREKELTDQNAALSGNINSMLVDSVAAKLASEIAVQGSADLLIPHIKGRLAAEQRDGQFVTVIRDAAGMPSAATLDDLKNEFIGNAVFAPVIVGSKATGGGAGGGNRGGGAAAKSVTRTAFEQMSAQQRMDHSKAGGTITD